MAIRILPPPPRVAALSVELPALPESGLAVIQVLPAGEFRAYDGRPEDVDAWRMDAATAKRLKDWMAARGRDLAIDYDHHILTTATTGRKAIASGWIKSLDWREGEGLFAVVDWTAAARAHIDAKEYRYISPVFTYDEQGYPQALLHVALTNDPALDGMDEVRLAAASRAAACMAHGGALSSPPAQSPKENTMNELLKALLALLGLPEDASEEDALAKLQEYADAAQENADKVASLTADVTRKEQEVVALKANSSGKPDPAKFVPVAALSGLQDQVAALTTAAREREVDGLVVAALSAGKLIPALETWARDLGKKDPAQLKAYLDQAPAIAALSGTQTGGRKPDAGNGQLSDDELAVCRAMGLDPAAFAKFSG